MKFLSKYFHSEKKRSEIWAVCASSWFLADMIVCEAEMQNANVIVELWAGTGVFTKRIFNLVWETKKEIFIVEKDFDFYTLLIKKFPEHRYNILNIDVLELENILTERWIDSVDLVISSLPFKSLPLEVFKGVMNHFLWNFSHSKTLFKQFSYFPCAKMYKEYFWSIKKQFCFFNVPPATIFTCTGYKK